MFPNLNSNCWFYVATGSTLFTVFAGAYYIRKRKAMASNAVPTKWRSVGNVDALHLFPIKSGHRMDLQRGKCTELGMQISESDESPYQLRDRSFIIYKEENKEFRTARTYPKISTIKVSVQDAMHVTINAPDIEPLTLKIPSDRDIEKAYIIHWNEEHVPGVDCGDEVSQWLSKYILEKPSGLRLAFHEGLDRRHVEVYDHAFLKTYPNLSRADTGMFSDLSSYHLINQGSIDDLNGRLTDKISANNFRPNIVVTGPEPFAEDSWDWIKIGEAIFRNFKPCTRCIMTTIDPETGIRASNREPLKTLESYRLPSLKHIQANGKSPVMGLNLGLKNVGEISVGDIVYVGIN